MSALLVLVGFLIMVVLGFPVFAAMGLSAIAGMFIIGEGAGLALSAGFTVSQSMSSFVLVAIPLYILVGSLMEQAGFSERLFSFARTWVGRLPGGLGVATVGACALFAAISGSSVATVATIGVVAFPALKANGYSAGFSGALIASGGTLGILIPPSIVMILYGMISEQSIGKLFMAGIIPGLLLSVCMAIYTMLTSRGTATGRQYTWREKADSTLKTLPVLMLPALVLGFIYSGFATPTEAAALAVAYVLILGLITRRLKLSNLIAASRSAMLTTAMIFMLVAFGRMMTEFFALSGLPEQTVSLVTHFGLNKFSVVVMMVLVLLSLGTILEAMSMMLIAVPILFPITQQVGIDPIAFGVFVVLAIEAAQITPPIGINLFTIASVGKVDIRSISLHILPYLGMIVALMFLVLYWEGLATWLPSTM